MANANYDVERVNWLLEGNKLAAEKAQLLEQKLLEDPDNLQTRLTLLGYYTLKTDERDCSKRKDLVIWLIDNKPEINHLGEPWSYFFNDDDNYKEIKKRWMEVIDQNPSNAAILGNAAKFLSHIDRAAAEELFKRASEAAPQNTDYLRELAWFLNLQNPKRSLEALSTIQKALELEKDSTKHRPLMWLLMQIAYDAGDENLAGATAEELLSKDALKEVSWQDGQLVHDCNAMLGLIALARGDEERAKAHLRMAAESQGSPALGSFGPDMKLAQGLLNAGCTDEVISYLTASKKFWKHSPDLLDQWLERIKQGQIPDLRRMGGE